MLKQILTAAALIASVALPTSALAQAGITLEVMSEDIRIEDGVEIRSLVPVESALPGQEIVYKLTLDNPDEIAAADIDLTLPINTNITLAPYSFSSEDPYTVEFSADGGTVFSGFADLKIVEDGTERAAVPEDITHAKIFISSIEGGAETEITYRASVK